MSNPQPNRAGIDSLLARLKRSEAFGNDELNAAEQARGEWAEPWENLPEAFAAALLDLVQRQDEELARVSQNSYAHMCRWDHVQIGHSESGDDERCPLCQKIDEADDLRAENDSLKAAEEAEPTNEEWGQSACRWARLDEPTWHWLKAASAEAYGLAAERAKVNP